MGKDAIKRWCKTYRNATIFPRSYLRLITIDQRSKRTISRGRDRSGFSVGYASKIVPQRSAKSGENIYIDYGDGNTS